MYTSRLDQILDNDMIPDNLKNDINSVEPINNGDIAMNSGIINLNV